MGTTDRSHEFASVDMSSGKNKNKNTYLKGMEKEIKVDRERMYVHGVKSQARRNIPKVNRSGKKVPPPQFSTRSSGDCKHTVRQDAHIWPRNSPVRQDAHCNRSQRTSNCNRHYGLS